jgi:polar amino acid transport system substrate-binding protein
MLTAHLREMQPPVQGGDRGCRVASFALALLALMLSAWPAAAAEQALPAFGVPALRHTRPDLGGRHVIRFITSVDWPPFQFLGPDGGPAGFDVDLARTLCAELKLACTLQARPWKDLVPDLAAGRADAVVAGLRPTPALRATADLTTPYFRLPARFAVRRTSRLSDAIPETLASRAVAVVAGSAHAAYLRAFFPRSTLRPFPDEGAAFAALKDGKADALFGDGVAMARWLAGTASAGCCRFLGGPYLESHFFGEGLVIAVRKGDAQLRAALDYALAEAQTSGKLSELYLRWFPLDLFGDAHGPAH